jgi:hypothetical protein
MKSKKVTVKSKSINKVTKGIHIDEYNEHNELDDLGDPGEDSMLSKKYEPRVRCSACSNNECEAHTANTYYMDKEVIECAKDIVKGMKQSNEQLLVAQTQSGKTDVVKRILDLQINNRDYFKSNLKINNIVFIICASDTDLRDSQLQELYNLIDNDRYILHLGDINRLCKNIDTVKARAIDYQIVTALKKNCLIIFDEAHCDIEDRSIIDSFRKKLGIPFDDPMQSGCSSDIKVLNISATPYEHSKTNIKVTILHPKKSYYGVVDMFKTKKVFPAYDLLKPKSAINNWFSHIKDQLNSKFLPSGYYIVRLNSCLEYKKFKANIGEYFKKGPAKYDITLYDMDSDFDINERFLNIEPKCVHFIVVYNRLRKGKRISKEYIVAVHDRPATTTTHTTYQGLPGRMCGYNANKGSLIYCDVDKLEEHMKWIQNDYSIDLIPNHSVYIDRKTGLLKDKCMLKH